MTHWIFQEGWAFIHVPLLFEGALCDPQPFPLLFSTEIQISSLSDAFTNIYHKCESCLAYLFLWGIFKKFGNP